MFLLYVNDLPELATNTIKLFADDSNVFVFNKNVSNLFTVANNVLQKIKNWCLANKLAINLNKTNYMILNNNNKANDDITKYNLQIRIGDSIIARV